MGPLSLFASLSPIIWSIILSIHSDIICVYVDFELCVTYRCHSRCRCIQLDTRRNSHWRSYCIYLHVDREGSRIDHNLQTGHPLFYVMKNSTFHTLTYWNIIVIMYSKRLRWALHLILHLPVNVIFIHLLQILASVSMRKIRNAEITIPYIDLLSALCSCPVIRYWHNRT